MNMGRAPFKGRLQCSCARCGRPKGDRDRNAGWYEVRERGSFVARTLCPRCAPSLLVALDDAQAREVTSNQRVISTGLLADTAKALRDAGQKYSAELLENLIGSQR